MINEEESIWSYLFVVSLATLITVLILNIAFQRDEDLLKWGSPSKSHSEP